MNPKSIRIEEETILASLKGKVVYVMCGSYHTVKNVMEDPVVWSAVKGFPRHDRTNFSRLRPAVFQSLGEYSSSCHDLP